VVLESGLEILSFWTNTFNTQLCSHTFKRHLKSELFFQAYGVSTITSTVADPWDWCFFSLTICVFSSFLTCFSVIRSVCWHLHIYIVKRRRPSFVGGAIEISLIDWLIVWIIWLQQIKSIWLAFGRTIHISTYLHTSLYNWCDINSPCLILVT